MATTKRTDSHRPGAITPALYTHLVCYSLATTWRRRSLRAIGLVATAAAEERAVAEGCKVYGRAGKCGVCGAVYVYGSLFRHESGDVVHMGHDCADKYSMMYDKSAYELERGRVEAALAKEIEKERRLAARKAWLEAQGDLEVLLDTDHPIVNDLRERSLRGPLTDAQVDLVRRIAAEQLNRRDAVAIEEPTEASFARLRDGGWGLRIVGRVAEGATVRVVRRDGSASDKVVGRIVWTGQGVTLAEIAA